MRADELAAWWRQAWQATRKIALTATRAQAPRRIMNIGVELLRGDMTVSARFTRGPTRVKLLSVAMLT